MIEKVAWIRLENGRVLAARSRGKDAYYLPGGKPEPGESAHEALIREIREELGVDLLPETIAPAFTVRAPAHGAPAGTEVRMTCFTADHSGTPAPRGEIAEVAWLSPADRARTSRATRAALDRIWPHGEE
ncbi:NUDIX hydrolase [Streptomyces griseocarneus]|uniref:NUDIX hydrolase n=1 Tax=Streptomyces griseocarneus TaxID=51201 RepID=UPI00167D7890|nr:NUDIX domain-containing protein [Streptomyces griseocarneus]MBZ6475181.1 NUDIX domain-containing protein [Streptomyces griseocarneus]GHG61792.1 DNA mismatch repair protein MutT [Streptomyces griseocarneus]